MESSVGVRKALKRSDTIVGLVRDVRKISRAIRLGRRRSRIESYLGSTETKKLQIGAGPTTLDGWLGTDLAPQSDHLVYLDATKRFPFEDNTLDYIYSEHMIEHISWPQGLLMLKECQRVMKPGGRIRIATPDLEVIIGLYRRSREPQEEKYIKWITDNFLDIHVYKPSFVINNAFHNWGHQFLYDGDLLEMAMQYAGFTDIQRYLPGESNDGNFRGIESHGKNVENEEMSDFETMVYEGKCPG